MLLSRETIYFYHRVRERKAEQLRYERAEESISNSSKYISAAIFGDETDTA
jgi:hypothetical protein